MWSRGLANRHTGQSEETHSPDEWASTVSVEAPFFLAHGFPAKESRAIPVRPYLCCAPGRTHWGLTAEADPNFCRCAGESAAKSCPAPQPRRNARAGYSLSPASNS
jgi:hypothetical protein